MVFTIISLLQSCAPSEHDNAASTADRVSFLAFGDSGYDYRFNEIEQATDLNETEEEFINQRRRKWLKKGYPAYDFHAPPRDYIASLKSYVEASGLFPVADAMHDFCLKGSCDFALMLGDNIYPDGATLGADGVDDAERFDRLLKQPFGKMARLGEDFRIYATLGNHDWNTSRGGAMAQVEYLQSTPPFYMNGVSYSIVPEAANGLVELFVVDTEILLATTKVFEDKLNSDGTEQPTTEISPPLPWTKPTNKKELEMLGWLEQSLQSSNAKLKIVIGHHPLWSSGGTKFTQARALREIIIPTLCKYADAYIAGHEHSLEIHEDDCSRGSNEDLVPPLTTIVSGAGAKQRAVNQGFLRQQIANNKELKTIWSKGMVWGFSHVELFGDTARIKMYSTDNRQEQNLTLEFDHQFKHRSE